MISNNVVIMTTDELAFERDVAFAKGVKRGVFEAGTANIHIDDLIDAVANTVFSHFFSGDWPPSAAVDLGMDAPAFRKCAEKVLRAIENRHPVIED